MVVIYINGVKANDSRVLVLSDSVHPRVVGQLTQRILDISAEDEKKLDNVANLREDLQEQFELDPIWLIVNSGGGSVHDGFALIGAMEMSVTPIYTVCMGQAMSMALAIFMAGHQRYANQWATFMYHEISSASAGNLSDHRRNVEYMNQLQRSYDTFITTHSSIRKEKLQSVRRKGIDWFFTAEQAKRYGVVHEIYPVQNELFLPQDEEMKVEETGEDEE